MISFQNPQPEKFSTLHISVHPLITEYRMQYGLGEDVRETLIKFVDSIALKQLGQTLKGYEGYTYRDAERITQLLEKESEVNSSIMDGAGTNTHFLAWVKSKKNGSSIAKDANIYKPNEIKPQAPSQPAKEPAPLEGSPKAQKLASSSFGSGLRLAQEPAPPSLKPVPYRKSPSPSSTRVSRAANFNPKEVQKEIASKLREDTSYISLKNPAEHVALQAGLLERIIKEDKTKTPLRKILALKRSQIALVSSEEVSSVTVEAEDFRLVIKDRPFVCRLIRAKAGLDKAPQEAPHLSHLAGDSALFFSLIGDLSSLKKEPLPGKTIFGKICDQQKPLLKELIEAGVSIFELAESRLQHVIFRKNAIVLMNPEDSHRSPVMIKDEASKDAIRHIFKLYEDIQDSPIFERPLFCAPNGRPLIPNSMLLARMLAELESSSKGS